MLLPTPMTNSKPVHEIRIGRIKAALWSNPGTTGAWHSVTVSRLYKGETGWRSTDSFGRDDLPLLIKVLVRAHDWMYADDREPEDTPE